MYTPDAWVVVSINHNGEAIRKVLAGWYGGYARGDSWKLNSGIEKTVETDEYYDFHGYSGSVYRCYKNCERMTGLMSMIYSSIEGDASEGGVSIEVVSYAENGVQ